MSIWTNLQGRLRNTTLPAGSGLLPVFEAVANSIHAIEDANLTSGEGRIVVLIERDGQRSMDFEEGPKRRKTESKGLITGFTIRDNGVGFTDQNLESFTTLDSDYKAARGGRGVGRLLWLKAFDRAVIESTYKLVTGEFRKRNFTFDSKSGVSEPIEQEVNNVELRTEIKLLGFASRYREAVPKTAAVIARNLFEHCLWYFIRDGGAPAITVVDDDEAISLDEIYDEQMIETATVESIELKGVTFNLLHIKLSTSSQRGHSIAFCADNRVVTQESIRGKIPGLFGSLEDDGRPFFYECYVTSKFLNERVRSERTSFDIAEQPLELFESEDISQQEIRDAVLTNVESYLSQYLTEMRRLGSIRVAEFVERKAPRYRPILKRIPESQLIVDPDIGDKDLEALLHKHLSEIESKLLQDGHDIMHPHIDESYAAYRSRLDQYLQTVEDIKRSDLASYVSHRRVIIDLLDMAVKRDSSGHYVREDLIHSLIMPMHKDSNDLHFENCNLWLIDERLAFHDYLASDKPISSMPITDAEDGKEPDIVALNVFDNSILVSESTSLPPASLVIIEIKRPMRNDAASGEEKDPIEQALGYLERIRRGNVRTSEGRLIPQSETIPGFCYVLCDLTPTMIQRCKMHDGILTSDGLGYFFYKQSYGAYVEVISFDRLIKAAKERNKAFFDKLGLPTT